MNKLHLHSEFDLVLDGYNFSGLILAHAALNAGLHVAIINAQKTSNKFEPIISSFYPNSFFKIPDAIKNYTFLRACASPFPHLLYPQRLLCIDEHEPINTKFTTAADSLLRLDQEYSALPITFHKYENFRALTKNYNSGVLLFEYRLDYNRAIKELLNKCLAIDDRVIVNNSISDTKAIIKCIMANEQIVQITIDNFKLITGNNLLIKNRHFKLFFQCFNNNLLITICFEDKDRPISFFESEILKVLDSLEIPSPKNLNELIAEALKNKTYPKESISLTENSLSIIRKNVKFGCDFIRKKTGIKIDVEKRLFLTMEKVDYFESFLSIQSECDKKFDEAKQTGIPYPDFTYYFFRYRPQIDFFIERAYEKLNLENEAKSSWIEIEKEFIDAEETLFM